MKVTLTITVEIPADWEGADEIDIERRIEDGIENSTGATVEEITVTHLES